MTALVLPLCLVLAWADPPPQQPSQPANAPTDVVAALETAISDAIGKAEPSVVAISRDKGENTQVTQAVRGRKRPLSLHEPRPLPFDPRFPRAPERPNLFSFDFGSGVVIGTDRSLRPKSLPRTRAATWRSSFPVRTTEATLPSSSRSQSATRARYAKGRS
jgi:hypothetical protein